MKEMERKLNFHYAANHAAYWMYFGVLAGFSSVYLLSKGYSNSEIGLILASGNILAILIQSLLAELADKGKKRTIFTIIGVVTALNLVLSTFMIFQKERNVGLTFLFVSCFALMMTNQPFINSVNRRLEECGVTIAFGTCRSIGSLSYAIICFFLGILVEKNSAEILPWVGDIVLVLSLLVLYATFKAYQGAKAQVRETSAKAKRIGQGDESDSPKEPEPISLKEFVSGNKPFFIMSFGILALYFANTIPNAYMAQIVDGIGGNSADVGRIFAFLAITEIPTLILFDKLYQRFTCQGMLKFAAVAYVVWMGACTLAKSVGMLSLAQLLHFFSFPLFLPAMVRFIDDNMREGEAVRGQTLFTVMITAGNMLASLIGGVLLDLAGAKVLMTVGTIVAAIGAVIIWLMIDKEESTWNSNTIKS